MEYDNPSMNLSAGDGVIESNSVFYGPLKFAHDFITKKENAKPIKIVEICGIYNKKYDPYDNEEGEKEIQINEYLGILCDCYDDPKKICSHSSMNTDSYFIKFMVNTHRTNEISYSEEYEKMIADFDDSYLTAMASNDCPQLFL